MMLLAACLALAAPAEPVNPRALDLFEAEPMLMRWALATQDGNGDGWISLFEAQGAAEAFKVVADSDRDGRVTVGEYRAAVSFLSARHALAR